ncbi:MAG: hypothetical protein M3O70_09295, partial [Actinomycetota bacterium]|nr:hypothetical protein [Actinomycetota bacterium]
STGPSTPGDSVVEHAKGTSDAETMHHFPEEERTEGATEQEKRDRREGTVQGTDEEESLGPGGPGTSVSPDDLR